MTHDSIILCKSSHHGNTRMVAEAIAQVLSAEILDPDDAMLPSAGGMMLIGLGSGVYYGRFHRSIRKWVSRLRSDAGEGHRVFIFSTSGLPFLLKLYHAPLRRALKRKGFYVEGEFSCRGHDSFAFLKLVGGINRHHPNQEDLELASRFANQLPR